MYGILLFDLDGTLTDPVIGITNSVMYALKKFGIDVSDRTELYRFIGPPLKYSFENFYGIAGDRNTKAIEYYREYFSVQGIYENEIYSGISDMLDGLCRQGKRLIIATSKPEIYAKEIVRHFGIDKYFEFVGGATMDGSRGEKADVIRYALLQCGIEASPNVVMIGDRKHDILGAKAVGIDSIGVLYGYGSRDELISAGATHIAPSVKDIVKIV